MLAGESKQTPEQVARKLAQAKLKRNVKKWGEIKDNRAVLRMTCRRCGTSGEFRDQQDGRVFEDHHNGVENNGKCPLEKYEVY